MFKAFAMRVRQLLRDESGLATVEWIGLAMVIIAVLVVVANAMKSADGTSLATKLLEAIGRMVEKVQ